jgi:hypothetical protein
METNFEIGMANCPECLNTTRDELLADPLIHQVTIDSGRGCWQVNHDYKDPEIVAGMLHRSLRGWEVAGNGEIVMIGAAPKALLDCPHHPGAALRT